MLNLGENDMINHFRFIRLVMLSKRCSIGEVNKYLERNFSETFSESEIKGNVVALALKRMRPRRISDLVSQVKRASSYYEDHKREIEFVTDNPFSWIFGNFEDLTKSLKREVKKKLAYEMVRNGRVGTDYDVLSEMHSRFNL
jgi:hypothetical protein